MFIMRLKVEQKVVGELKYTKKELNKLLNQVGLSFESLKYKVYWDKLCEAMAEAIFKEYNEITSVFFFDTIYEDLDHVSEVTKEHIEKVNEFDKACEDYKRAQESKEEELNPAIYDWDYEPTAEELNGEPIDCEEF